MSDINLLPSSGPQRDEKDARAKKADNEDLALHVPAPDAPEKPVASLGGSFLSQLIEAEKAEAASPASLFSQKIDSIPNALPKPALKPSEPAPPVSSASSAAPKTSSPSIPAKAGLPPPPVPPKKPPLPPRNPEPEEKGSGTLRVSLITSGGGAGLSDLTLKRRQKTFAIASILGVLTDMLVFGGLHLRKLSIEKENAEAQKTVQDVDARIAAREAELAPVRDFQALSRAAARVLDAHAHWTQVLKLLEERALPDVRFGSLAGAETGTLGFEVTARDYTTLAKQIVAFRQDPRVKKVTVGTASADVGENNLLQGVRSAMTLEIQPSIFRYVPPTASAGTGTVTP